MKQNTLRRATIDRAVIYSEDIINLFLANYRRNKLSNTDFSIISNNCWGGHVYRRYHLPYTSPTVGLYFFADDYIRFVMNLDKNLHSNIEMISANESRHFLELQKKGQLHVPVGVLNDDIEIIFLHYHSKQEAEVKWKRRASRVNFENLIVKFSEMNGCTDTHIKQFHELPFDKKILLLSKKNPIAPEGIVVHRYADDNSVLDDTTYYSKHFPLDDFIGEKQ